MLDVPENIPMVIRDRSAPEENEEIEITPEMIEAGSRALLFYDPELDSGFELVSEVYRLMETTRTHAEVG